MRFELCVSVVITIIVQRARCLEQEECIKGHSGRYVGTRSVTASGTTCQRWNATTPHQPRANHRPRDGRRHNYCRNPDNDLQGTWCYTTDINKRWEYCNITKCPEDSYLYWTSFNSTNTQTLILSAHADPEVMRRRMTSSKSFNTTTVVDSNETNSEYWALTSHPRRKQLYYTDYRQEYLAVWDINKGEERRYFEGITHGIENLAIDWKTDNLYWTDSTFKWIMAAESHFKHYAVVYQSTPEQVPYGLTIHQTRRYMIFSTYEAQNAKIVRTDLAGKDAVELFVYPEVLDITGITIDYEEDRLYWTDFTGYGGKIISSRLDGSNKTEHIYLRGSILWGLVTYKDFVYTTDVHTKYRSDGKRYYRLWFMPKWSTNKYNYQLPTKPRGIAVLLGNEETAYRNDSNWGECGQNHGCDHVCFPRINSSSECACSLGYQLASDKRRCIYNLLDDNYLIFTDGGQGKVFQMSIDDGEDKKSTATYNIVPLDDTQTINRVTLDINRGYVFWSSKKAGSLYRANIDGKERLKIADVYAIRVAVDPQTGNIFYVEEDLETIVVSKGDGSFSKTIRTTNKTAEKNFMIGMITVDVKYKYLYWIQRFIDIDGTDRLMRCKFDGSAEEVVLDGLKSPHAITVDYQTDKLYVVEAEKVRIFEVALSLLNTISNTSISGSNFRVYDIANNFNSPYITDIKVLGGIAYMSDSKNHGFRTFNFSSQATPKFGPEEFAEITTVSIFKKSYYNDYIESVPNPCSTNPCQGLCLPLNANDSQCICGDGKADSDCVTEKNTVTTDASANPVAMENTTGGAKPYQTTPSPGSINDIVNRIWAIILNVLRLCKSENSTCFQ